MLVVDLILLIVLGRAVVGQAARTGRSGWPWVVFLVLSWLIGELVGAATHVLLSAQISLGDVGGSFYGLLAFVYAGAAAGGTLPFVFLNLLPAMHGPDRRDRPTVDDETKVWEVRRAE